MYAKPPRKRRPPLEAGAKFGMLTAIRYIDHQNKHQRWLWVCDCGNEKVAQYGNVYNGVTRSCGCWQRKRTREAKTTHGLTNTVEYTIWCSMKDRCFNPKSVGFHNYGGRGITIDHRWLEPEMGFLNFLEDMGARPSDDLSLERKDNDGPYSKANCKWATELDQACNKRNTVKLTLDGVTKPLTVWARELGVPYSRLRSRLVYGWDDKSILTIPYDLQRTARPTYTNR